MASQAEEVFTSQDEEVSEFTTDFPKVEGRPGLADEAAPIGSRQLSSRRRIFRTTLARTRRQSSSSPLRKPPREVSGVHTTEYRVERIDGRRSAAARRPRPGRFRTTPFR